MQIRTANPATDFERIAELLTAIDAEPTSVEDLHEDEGRVVPGKLTPMLRINDRLGFEREPGYYELQLALD